MITTKDQSGYSSHIFDLWVKSSRTVNTVRAGEDIIDRLLMPPWESTDQVGLQAWDALTHPANLDGLIEWAAHDLNPRAREYTEKAIEVCRSRAPSSGEPFARGNAG